MGLIREADRERKGKIDRNVRICKSAAIAELLKAENQPSIIVTKTNV